MKKIFLVMLLSAVMISIYSETIEQLIPLRDTEILDYSYDQDKDILTIYKINGSNKNIYYESGEVLWAYYQISEDKRSLIFWKNANYKSVTPLYYLDGTNGKVKYLGDFTIGARMDRTGTYLIYENVWQSGIFTIYNLKTCKKFDQITWNLLNKDKWTLQGGTFSLLRAYGNDKYDFIVIFDIEYKSIAKAFIKVSPKKIVTEFDDSNLTELSLRDAVDYGAEFAGWY